MEKKKYVQWKNEDFISIFKGKQFYGPENPNITWDIVQKNPHIEWYYPGLSRNPNITWDIVRDNPDKDWSYPNLSLNPNITLEIVKANPNKPWRYCLLGYNINTTFDIIKNNPEINWNDEEDLDWFEFDFSQNPNITWDIVQQNPDKDWYYPGLAVNPNFTWDIIELNRDKYELRYLLENPSIYKELAKNYNLTSPQLVLLSNNIGLYNDTVYTFSKRTDLKYRQNQLQKLFVSFSPFCEDLDYFFRKYLNYV